MNAKKCVAIRRYLADFYAIYPDRFPVGSAMIGGPRGQLFNPRKGFYRSLKRRAYQDHTTLNRLHEILE